MKRALVAAPLLVAAIWVALWLSAPAEPLLEGIPFGTVVLDDKGAILRLGLTDDDKYRLHASLDEVAPEAARAAIEYEDRYFYQHPGVNPVALIRAFASLFGGRRIGASTITMQVARLRYGLNTASVTGKLRQIWLALALETRHGKEEILEAYFNLAPYGGNIEGIEAASRIYFHKPANQLTTHESRALAIVPQNPGARNPASGHAFVQARALAYAKSEPLPPLRVFATREIPFSAPHLALELEARATGERLETFINGDLQRLLENALRAYTDAGRRYGIANTAAILLHWPDMRVHALAGSAGFGDAAISGQIDGTRARRSPGSTLKPFIYALALDQGLIHPHTILPDSPRSFGGYDPENFDRGFRGPIAAHEALKTSRNLPAIYLAGQLENPDLYAFLARAGIRFEHGHDYYGLALALGGAEISARELASLYAMLANQGIWRPLRFAKSDSESAQIRMLSPESAWLALDMLRREDGAIQSQGRQIPYIYKTGTSNGMRDAWTAGIIGQYALVVWIGNFDNSSNPEFVGASAALPLFEKIAHLLAGAVPLKPFPLAPPASLNLVRKEICANSGDLYAGQCQSKAETWLIPGVSPTRDSGILRKILVDRETGMRACAGYGGETEEIWHEFWPSDMRAIFAKAGIAKPDPPDWLPECRSRLPSRKAPRIILPKKHVAYYRRPSDSGIPLLAAADADAGKIFWYAGGKFLGSARPGEILYWNAPVGRHALMAVDETGKGGRQECLILLAP